MPISIQLTVWSSLAALALAVGLPAQSGHTEASHNGLQEEYDSAQRLQQSGDLDQAARQYRAFLGSAQGELAAAHAEAGDYSRAASLFNEALAMQPDSPELRLGYARTALLMGDLPLAEKLSRAFLADDIGDAQKIAEGHQILGRALLKMNRDQEARAEMQKAVDLAPSFANRYDLAVVCLDQDDGKCASQSFQALEQSFGDTPTIHMQFGLAYGNSDFAPQAIDEFRKVIVEDPRYPEAHYSLAAALLAVGNDQKNVPEAETELKKELAISPRDFLTYAALGKLAVGDHRYAEADTYLKRAILLNPHNPDAYLYLGQMYFETNRPADAEAALRKAIAFTRDPARNRYQIQKAYFLLGRVLMQEHRPDEAHAEMELSRTYANKGLSHDKSQLAGLLNNSEVTGSSENSSNSAPSLSAVPQEVDSAAMIHVSALEKRLTPAIADSYNNLGVIAAASSNYTNALHDFEEAAAWNPKLEELDLNWGRAAFMSSNFSEAVPPLARYARLHPEDRGIRGALAMSQFMTHDYRGCIATFKGVEDKLDSIPQFAYVYAESLVLTGQVAAGKTRLESLEAAHPEIAEVHRALGEVFAAEGNKQKAGEEFEKAIELNTSDPEAHYDLGKMDVESGEAGPAITELETATRLSPDDPAFHQELSAAYALASRNEDAKKELAIYQKLKSRATPSGSSTAKGSGDATRP